MDYEKAFKEAYERASLRFGTNVANGLFLEYKESKEERTRRKLIEFFSDWSKTKSHCWGIRVTDIMDWLEKQGEYDIDCPKNHQDSSRPNGCIVLEDFNGGEGFYKLNLDYLNKRQVEEVEEMIRTWNKESKTSNENIKNCIGMCLTDVGEQRFKDYNTSLKDCLAWLEKQDGRKPAEWSEKDDVMVNDILRCLPSKSRPEYNQRRIDWLKSLKGRVQPQPKQEWKQENREELTEFENAMMHIGGSFFGENAGLDPNDTDTIKEQAELLLELAPKTEWSKEDERIYQSIIDDTVQENQLDSKQIDWLKFLKQRYTWKPSKEQMDAMQMAVSYFGYSWASKEQKLLESLYKDLKKLQEE